MLFWRLLAQIGSSRYSIGLIFPCIVLTFFGLRKLMSMGKIYGGILLRWTIYTVFIGSIITLGVIKTARAKSTSKIGYFISLATVLKEEMQGKEPLLLSSNNDGLRILSLVKRPTTCVVKKLPPLEDSATIEQQFKQILERHDQLYLYISNHEKNELFTVFQEVVPRLKWKLLIDTGKNSLYSHQNFSPRMGTEVIP